METLDEFRVRAYAQLKHLTVLYLVTVLPLVLLGMIPAPATEAGHETIGEVDG